MEQPTFDIIVPVHLVDWRFLSSNINTWIKEIPINRILIGCSNANEDEFDDIKTFVSKFEQVEFIDQRGMKTLGMALADLMKRVIGDWFIFLHSDVELTPFCFKIMEAYMNNEKVGIVESERVQYDGKNGKRTYWNYHYIPRPFSGFQLIRKKAIESILDKINDDYIYRNEDIIFQNVCINNGFEYIKSWCMHVHNTTLTNRWTPQGKELEYTEAHKITMEMQIKGIIKYCTPTPITVKAFLVAFNVCKQHFGYDMYDFVESFVREVNPVWERAIFNHAMIIAR